MHKYILFLIYFLLFTQQIFADSHDSIEGHWSGKIVWPESITNFSFDIYNSPCDWKEPNATPYVSQFKNGNTDIIQTTVLPDGSKMLELFNFEHSGIKYLTKVDTWTSEIMKGHLVDRKGNKSATFAFTKLSNNGKFPHCFHKGNIEIKLKQKDIFNIPMYSLHLPRKSKAFCCDNHVFSECTLTESQCEMSIFDLDYGEFDLKGLYQEEICTGLALQEQYEGTFAFQDSSLCSQHRFE